MGSKSDKEVVKESGLVRILQDVFTNLNLLGEGTSQTIRRRYDVVVSVCSAHRNLPELHDYVTRAIQEGAQIFIGVAGMAAALPGAIAGASGMMTPVIGVPLDEDGIDSCLYMPPGVPVLLAGVGKPGLKNAAIAALQILALGNEDVTITLEGYLTDTAKEPEFGIKL